MGHIEATYLSHVFRARTPDGKLVQERQIDRVYITDCPAPSSIPDGEFLHPALLHPVGALPFYDENQANDTANASAYKTVTDVSRCSVWRGGVCEMGRNGAAVAASPSVLEQSYMASQQTAACLDRPCNLSPAQLSRRILARPRRNSAGLPTYTKAEL